MITGALELLHARKWLVELLVLLAIVGGVWWFCAHLIDVGVQRQKDADAAAYAKLQRDADLETGRLKGRAEAAEKARDQEISDGRRYRSEHPLHGGLCQPRQLPATTVAQGAAAELGDDQARPAAGDFQPVPAGDIRPGGRGDTDVRHLFDVLAGRADMVSADLREYKAR